MTKPETPKNLDICLIRSFLAFNSGKILESLTTFKQRGCQLDVGDDLFGNTSQEDKKIDWSFNFPVLKEIDILIEEKNSLGLYVSGNPISKFEPLEKFVKETLDREDIFLVLIDKSKKIMTRTNILMYALSLTTTGNESKYEGIIFPKKVMEVIHKVKEKEIFWIRGKVLDRNKKKADLKDGEDSENTYDEIPKIAVDDLCLITENPVNLFKNEESSIPINRQRILHAVNWLNIKNDPSSFLNKDLEKGEQIIESAYRDINIQNLNVKNNLEKLPIREIRIPSTTHPEILKQVKRLLKKDRLTDGEEIKLFVEVRGTWKQSKTTFYGNYDQIQKLLNNDS